jgi:hypothetical protein
VSDQAQQAHPLLDEKFPFRIEIYSIQARPDEEITAATPRKKKELVNLPRPGGDDQGRSILGIGARKDEMIDIVVRNEGMVRVGMALLVDGTNTLGGKRERLGEARLWVLDPVPADQPAPRFEGWYFPDHLIATPGGSKQKMNRFIFRDLAPVAGREKFGDAPGVITAAFYAERGRDLVLDKLQRDEFRALEAVDFKAGRLLGVVHIRYVDEADLKKLE